MLKDEGFTLVGKTDHMVDLVLSNELSHVVYRCCWMKLCLFLVKKHSYLSVRRKAGAAAGSLA